MADTHCCACEGKHADADRLATAVTAADLLLNVDPGCEAFDEDTRARLAVGQRNAISLLCNVVANTLMPKIS